MSKTTDTEAIEQIHKLLDGTYWDSSITSSIASIVNDTGRDIAEPGEHTREELIELLKEDWMASIAAEGGHLVDAILTGGFKGYDNMSYSELLKDARNNGLLDEWDND